MLNNTTFVPAAQRSANSHLMGMLVTIDQKTGHSSRPTGNGYITRCPGHEDRSPSLSVSAGDDGRILLHCHAGCTVDAICDAANISVRDLFPDSEPIGDIARDHAWLQPRNTQQQAKITEYHYKDTQGNIVFTKVKKEDNNGKAFYWQHIDASGTTVMGMPRNCDKILYNLPTVVEAVLTNEIIFLVEGEKDAETLINQGLIATTATESTTWRESFTDLFKNARIALLYDYDKAGFKRRDFIISNLASKIKSLRVIDLPGIEYTESHGKDITDWLNVEDNTIENFIRLVGQTPEYSTTPQKDSLTVVSLDQLLSLNLPPREMLLHPFLPSQGLGMLVAQRGVGKTHVALGISYAVASGGKFFGWSAQCPKKVLYIDGEMPAVCIQERLKMTVDMNIQKPAEGFFQLLTPDLQDGSMPDLSTTEGRAKIEALLDDVELVVIDNLSCMFRDGGENDSEVWQEPQEWILHLRKRGKTVLMVHHAGKGGKQRGTSKREDILDVVIMLKHPSDYEPSDGARFEVHFDKARHFAGENARAFEAQLIQQDDGMAWKISAVAQAEITTKVAMMHKDGNTIKEIGIALNLSKSRVETQIKKAREGGLIE